MKAAPSWITVTDKGVLVRFQIQPKASRSEIVGPHGEGENVRLKVRIAAPPVDGAANEELLSFLKKLTGIPSSRIHLIRGDTSKMKDVLFEGVAVAALREKLKH